MIDSELKSAIDALGAEHKSVVMDLKNKFDGLQVEYKNQQVQLDALDKKSAVRFGAPGDSEQKSVGELFTASAEFMEAKEAGFQGRGRLLHRAISMNGLFPLEQKTDITETALGTATSGVLVPQRIPGVVLMPRQALRLRDVMRVLTLTTGNSFDYVYEATRTLNASPQVEDSVKSQSYDNLQTTQGAIRTIAHYVKVTRQALDDLPWLRQHIDSTLTYGLKVKEENEILSGDGTGVHLNGIITQSTAFDTTLLPNASGWQRLDILRWAKLQARLAGLATYPPDAFVMHPTDLAHLQTTKNLYGNYLIGDPQTGAQMQFIWDLPVVESDSIASGTFLVGAFSTAATLVDRLQAMVDIAYQNEDDFVNNRVALLCEERIGLAVEKPTAFIHGSFGTSPA